MPVQYFHVVFTLPHALGSLALANKSLVYGLRFRAAWETLREIAAEPKHLGARIGMLAVLHTWGQRLEHHPHLHCVVPGGGLSEDGSRWVACRPGFFLPVRVVSRLFRGKFLAGLRRAFDRGEFEFPASLAALTDRAALGRWLTPLYHSEWVVYAKPPFGGPEQVLKYLARYTHRVAISNDRLLQLENGHVSFRFKNYARRSRWQTLALSAVEFLRRFLMHVLPRGFVRIRFFGLLAQRHRRATLDHCRRLLGVVSESAADPQTSPVVPHPDSTPSTPPLCPACAQAPLEIVEQWPRPTLRVLVARWTAWNTS